MSIEQNKELMRRYFREALDQGRPEIVDDLFTKDCTIYRPDMEPFEGSESVQMIVTLAHKIYSSFHTTINDVVAEGDLVAVRLTHDAVYSGQWQTRLGTFDCTDKKVQWEALVLFKMRDGKIAEERVFRDELGMMLEVGILKPGQ